MERDIEDIECNVGETVDVREMEVRIVGGNWVLEWVVEESVDCSRHGRCGGVC